MFEAGTNHFEFDQDPNGDIRCHYLILRNTVRLFWNPFNFTNELEKTFILTNGLLKAAYNLNYKS